MFSEGCVCTQETKRSSKIKSRTSRVLLAETPINPQRILFQPSVNAEQITRANDGPVVEITALPIALELDEEVPVTQMIPRVATRSRFKRRIVIADPKHDEQKE